MQLHTLAVQLFLHDKLLVGSADELGYTFMG
jgi:hypothetical protein